MAGDARPTVSVVMPFLGSAGEAGEALAALAALELGSGDELIVADNTPDGTMLAAAASSPAVRAVPAPVERSAYYARNVGAEQASGDWLLFIDADCLPPASLVGAYLDPVPADDVGAVAGRIAPAPESSSMMARWAASREVLSQERSLQLPGDRPRRRRTCSSAVPPGRSSADFSRALRLAPSSSSAGDCRTRGGGSSSGPMRRSSTATARPSAR